MNFFIFCNYICAKNKKENDIYQIPFINSFIKFIELCFHSSFNVGYLVGVAIPTSLLTSTVRGCNILPRFYSNVYIIFPFFYISIVIFLHLRKFFRNIPNYTFFISKLYYIIIFFILWFYSANIYKNRGNLK